MTKLSAIDIARKQRHLHLLDKVKATQPLSPAELKELDDYENQAKQKTLKPVAVFNVKPPAKPRKKATRKKAAKKKSAKKKTTKKKRTKKKRVRLPISAARVRVLAMEFETLAEADASIAESINLLEAIGLHKVLAAAWSRGRFLRNISLQAASPMTAQEAAYSMSMSPEQLAEILANDIEAADLWRQRRIASAVSIKMKLVAQADAGNKTAISQVGKMLADVQRPDMDFNKVSGTQMEALFGVTRMTMHKWRTEKGAPRHADCTWSLPAMIAWHAGFSASKTSGRVAGVVEKVNSFQDVKTQKIQLELDTQRGQLLDRDEVMAGFVARAQVIAIAAAAEPERLASELVGCSAGEIQSKIGEMFGSLKKSLQAVPPELKMNEKAESLFVKCLQELSAA